MYKFLVEEVSIYYWLEILVFSVFCVYIFSGTSLKSEKFSEKKSYFIRDFIVLITVHILISFLPVKSIGTVFTFSSVVLLPIAIFSMYHYIIYKDKKTFLKLILSVYFQLIAEVIFVEAYYIFVGVIVQNLGFLRNIMSLEPLADIIYISKFVITYLIYLEYKKLAPLIDRLEKRDMIFLGGSLVIVLIGFGFIDGILGAFEYDSKNPKMILMYTKSYDYLINSKAIIGIASMINLHFYIKLAGKVMDRADMIATQSIEIANEKYFDKVVQTEEKVSKIMHDIKNHMVVMRGMLDEIPVESYYKNLKSYVEDLPLKIKTGNFVADVVVNDKIDFMKDNGIDYDIKMAIPKDVIQDQHELSSILFNTIDNAIEASLNLDRDDRKIVIRSEMHGDFLKYSISNNYCACIEEEERIYGKKDNLGRGYGLKIVEEIVAKYHGSFRIIREDMFELRLYFKIR